MQITRSRWFAPAFVVAVGGMLFAAFWVGGRPADGAVALGVTTAFAAAIALARGDTVRGFRGDGADERFEQIGVRAGAFVGFVLTTVLAGGVLVRVAQGRDTGVFGWLALLAAGCYLAAFVWQRLRH